MQALGRPRSTGQEDYVLGTSASGYVYVKDLHVYREEGESEQAFVERGPRMLRALIESLPGGAEIPSKTSPAVDKSAAQAAAIVRSRGRGKEAATA